MSKYKLFLLRHGEGAWNKENRFCSWVDQKLSENGVTEAQDCGRLLKEQGYKFDIVFTSILSRSIQTAWLVLEAMGLEWIPVVKSWRLNERHYGSLIGLNRAEMALQHGEEKVKLWRRSYAITPPPIDESHPYFLEIYNDRRYNTCDVAKDKLPRAESLKEVLDRLLPYWDNTIVPEIRKDHAVLISAHGNSCRALLKHLEGISDEDIVNVTLPTGIPVLLELDENLRPVKPRQLLGDQAKIQAAIKKTVPLAVKRMDNVKLLALIDPLKASEPHSELEQAELLMPFFKRPVALPEDICARDNLAPLTVEKLLAGDMSSWAPYSLDGVEDKRLRSLFTFDLLH